ncbi:MAG: hypothetical protein HZB10_03315 [Candidatus Yonathbacteria bacterium]|nr:hypothetical protein [Candidatus Yonathbacteria bacterium]
MEAQFIGVTAIAGLMIANGGIWSGILTGCLLYPFLALDYFRNQRPRVVAKMARAK